MSLMQKNSNIELETDHWYVLLPLLWLSSYVTSHYLAVVPQSGAKEQFYCTIYYIALNSTCEDQRASKNLKKM
jgi:hypothetical protein